MPMPSPEYSIIDNKELSQFELRDMGPDANLLSFATHAAKGTFIRYLTSRQTHARRGEGFADLLMEGILDFAKLATGGSCRSAHSPRSTCTFGPTTAPASINTLQSK